MATIREGGSALLVVDVQVGVVDGAWERDRVVQNVALAVARARQAGAPVIWVQHHDAELERGSDAWQWAPELQPAAGEARVHKSHNSAFEQTELDELLAQRQVSRIVLAGAATNWCIRATAYAALDRGYDLTLVSDAHTTASIDLPGGRRVEAADIVADLNIAMQWLSYPGRANASAPAAEVPFAGAAQ